MCIVIAPDSFKESLTAIQVAQAIKFGMAEVLTEAQFELVAMADGGEGTAQAIANNLPSQWIDIQVLDPLKRHIQSKYLICQDDIGELAVIEMASASGLHLLKTQERNPLITSTFGVGQMILDALQRGIQRFILAIGGSATNDAGLGMLQALGYQFLDMNGNDIGNGGIALQSLAKIILSPLHQQLLALDIRVACDVQNPLCGEQGASHIYGAQKGATAKDINVLDQALSHFAKQVKLSHLPDCQYHAGAGAAGGLGFALMSFLQADLLSGFTLVSEICQLPNKIQKADLVITGEGKMDAQTAMGKVASGVLKLAQSHTVPVIAICGAVDTPKPVWQKQGYDLVLSSLQKLDSLENIFDSAEQNIYTTAFNLAQALQMGNKLLRK
ncbi:MULTISPECIES: glycerate kinase [unclassified Acinetobacter]|uniref:glycerate kinase n=1 Tax=unclassified Acinetobacter TaxID=196816 RepID=UPI0035B8B313